MSAVAVLQDAVQAVKLVPEDADAYYIQVHRTSTPTQPLPHYTASRVIHTRCDLHDRLGLQQSSHQRWHHSVLFVPNPQLAEVIHATCKHTPARTHAQRVTTASRDPSSDPR